MAREDNEIETGSELMSESAIGTPALFGGLKTCLRWDASSKNMHLDVTQFAESLRSLELKYKGRLNTSTGQFQYVGHVRKNIFTNTPSIGRVMGIVQDKSNPVDDERFLPAGVGTLLFRDWMISPGVGVASDSSRNFHYSLSIRKTPQILKRFDTVDTWLTAKADCEYNPRRSSISTRSGVRLKLYKRLLTDKQDLQVTLGYDVQSQGGEKKQGPFLKIQENNWTVRWQDKQWQFTYKI